MYFKNTHRPHTLHAHAFHGFLRSYVETAITQITQAECFKERIGRWVFFEAKMVRLALSFALLLHVAALPEASSGLEASKVLYERPISVDDKNYGVVKIVSRREPADIVHTFCQKHNLPRHVFRGILEDVCKQPRVECKREKPALFRTPIAVNGTKLGVLRILEGDEPADVIFHFAKKRPLIKEKMKRALLRHACKAMECTRNHALLYSKPVQYDGKTFPPVKLYSDDSEPTDVIHQYCHKHDLPRHLHRAILLDACKIEWITCNRTVPVKFKAPIALPGKGIVHLEIHDYQEPADVIDELRKKHNLTSAMQNEIMSHACRHTVCKRLEPAAFVDFILHPEKKNEKIYISILKHEEPADIIHQWGVEHDIPKVSRDNLLEKACDSNLLNCTRKVARLYAKPVQYDSVDYGLVEVFENEEPADTVHRFCVSNNLPRELRSAVIADVCAVIQCNRVDPVVLQINVTDENGTMYGDGALQLLESDEPADKLYEFTKETNITHAIKRTFLMETLCTLVRCTRDAAILFHKPIVVQGRTLPDITIYDLPDQEPTDVLYNYCIEHNVLGIHNQLLQHACRATTCRRAEPVILATNVVDEVGKILGKLKIKQGEEPADALFEFAKSVNASEELRRSILYQLCQREDLKCNRAEAIIYQVPVTHPDYGNFGILSVFEGKEPADVIEEFSNKIFLPRDFRGSIISHVCDYFGGHHYYKNCSRWVPLLFNQSIHFDNETLPRLEILGAGEPVDYIDRWANDHSISKNTRDTIIHSLCARDEIQCGRTVPAVFSITISEFSAKQLEILENEEAIDAITKFIRKSGAPMYKRQQIYDIACKNPRVTCTRKRGVYYRTKVEGVDEPFVIWDDNIETTDALYHWGKRNNVSWLMRDRIFRQIAPITKTSRPGVEAAIATFSVNNESRYYCKRIVSNAPFREYELFVGSIVASIFAAPLVAMKGWAHAHPVISSMYLGLSAMLSSGVSEFFADATRRPHSQLEASQYFLNYHVYDVSVREGQAPYDAVYEFGASREGAKLEVLRTPKFEHIFNGLCESGELDCRQNFAREEMFKAEVTQHGYKRILHYMRPLNESACEPIEVNGVKGTTCMREQAVAFCNTLDPPPSSCDSQIMGLINEHMVTYKKRKWNGRKLYRTLDSLMDAPNSTLWKRYRSSKKDYMKPCFRGPTPLGFSKLENERVHTLENAWGTFKDPDERAFYDQPCRIVFGAMCAKTKKSGDMIIETMQPE